MIVGVCCLDLLIFEASSLKGKRSIVKKIIIQVQNNFKVSIAEVGDNDLWQKSKLGISLVGNEKRFVNSTLDKVLNFIEKLNLAEILNYEIEIMNYNF
ncbi:MAG: DUF503 domain-containing protein [Thermodesulfobacteriota bacterium]|nr:DUF503 domain-containing protein [Thermodesulfobacteriota bacterium]